MALSYASADVLLDMVSWSVCVVDHVKPSRTTKCYYSETVWTRPAIFFYDGFQAVTCFSLIETAAGSPRRNSSGSAENFKSGRISFEDESRRSKQTKVFDNFAIPIDMENNRRFRENDRNHSEYVSRDSNKDLKGDVAKFVLWLIFGDRREKKSSAGCANEPPKLPEFSFKFHCGRIVPLCLIWRLRNIRQSVADRSESPSYFDQWTYRFAIVLSRFGFECKQ